MVVFGDVRYKPSKGVRHAMTFVGEHLGGTDLHTPYA
jgi:hypothetical protein